MARPKRSQQTRLTFTPLPSSSPAAKGYHKQIRDRAAAVSFDVSPSPVKRRRVEHVHGNENRVQHTDRGVDVPLPTPSGSSRHSLPAGPSDSEGDDSDPIRSTQRSSQKARKHAKQRQLDFSNARSSDTFDSPLKLASSSLPPSSSTRSGMFASQRGRRKKVVELSSDEESDGRQKSSSRDEVPAAATRLRRTEDRTRTAGGGNARELRSSDRTVALQSEEEEGDEEEDNIILSSGRRRRQVVRVESEDEMPSTIGKQPRQNGGKKPKRRNSLDDFISSSPPQAASDDDVIIVGNPNQITIEIDSDAEEVSQKSRKRRRSVASAVSEDEDEDIPPVTPRRRLLKRPKQLTQEEKDELENDLEFLRPSSDEDTARAPRSTQSTQKSARLQALAKLKQKRAGQPETVVEEGDSGDDQMPSNDDDPDDNLLDDSDDDVQITSSRQMFRATEEDEEFIEEEPEDGVLGVPEGIPLQFTRFGSMKAKQLFKYAVEWMVQKKINPAFQMNDEIYTLTFKKLDDEVQGLAGSKFTSAAWTPEFTTVLRARPEIEYTSMDRSGLAGILHDKCDACNRTGHPATFEVQFAGKPYVSATLEEVAGNDDDDDEDEDDDSEDSSQSTRKAEYDSSGHALPSTSKIYYVGKFCMANARTAHALQHWRIHLNEWVVGWLDREGYNDPAEVVRRDRLSVRKRRKTANKIVDRMEQEGVVKQLWREYRSEIDEARDSKQGRFGGGSSP